MRTNFKILTSIIFAFVVANGLSTLARAQDESEEARVNAERAKHRRYPGGRDEQELTVQAVLPQPTRNPEAPKPQAAKPAAGSEDETHD